jgi:cilia- and flagella-associated protein 251
VHLKRLKNYYLSQGIQSNDQRKITKTIPLSEIPFIMRGLGFYPSEQEIDDMINEVKFSKYVDTNEYVDAIDLNEFIKCNNNAYLTLN